MLISIALNLVVASLALITTTEATDEVITSLIQAYSTDGGESQNYFSSRGKTLFEQVSMLESMGLAKLGRGSEASDQLASFAVQTMLADLPVEFKAAGGLMKLMQSDRSFFKNTIESVQTNLDTVSQGIKEKLSQFQQSSQKTNEDKQKLREEIKASVANQDRARQNILDAWKADFEGLRQLAEASKPSPKALRAWHVYGSARFLVKNLEKQVKQLAKYKPLGIISDILGIVVSGMGLHDAIKNKNTMGMVNSVLGIVGCVVALSLYTAALFTGLQVLSTISGVAGIVFWITPLIIKLIWPKNMIIETANALTNISRNDLKGYQDQLGRFTESGAHSFGWLYQLNSGLLLERKIQPNTPIKFWQPSCTIPGTTPCDPKTAQYQDERYLILGRKRKFQSTNSKFKLDLPYDFLGVPTESKFCGNTINIDTLSFQEYLNFRMSEFPRRINRWEKLGEVYGKYQRNVEIDTQAVPQYNDVDLNQWLAKDQTVKREREPRQLDAIQDIKCEPESDRISIDDLSRMNPSTGRVTINTGSGKDVLFINGNFQAGRSKDYLVADLGADENMLSVGAAIPKAHNSASAVAGVLFDNRDGLGRLCYRKNEMDAKEFALQCVGTVRNVTIFKGSRLHDYVIMGAQGPFTVIQNSGANAYHLIMEDIMTNRKPGQPTRFAIMDTSGNLPFIKICQARDKRVTIETKENDVIKLKASDGEVVVEIRVTGYAPRVDIVSICEG
ncbi:hypothetical protein ACROYT_G014871 [Oculina patagonica]